jgi:hypothetical protein
MDEVMDVLGPIVATQETAGDVQAKAIAELEKRVLELEAAIGDFRTVKASAAQGRKTAVSGGPGEGGSVDEALRSLSVEQRIAVKSGLMRAGVL